ncbi:MAG: hypothetical protein GX594_03475, partial [Pirellulaceae bacterium]|nr:hypothetical protein [Pirellulaceae bacterium]
MSRIGNTLPQTILIGMALQLGTPAPAAEADEPRRSIQVELPNQGDNPIKTSWPGVGTWFWIAGEFKPEGYKPFIDLYARHTNIRLLMTSIRHPVWVDDPVVHGQIKAAAAYARSQGLAMVMDLDVRLARQKF